MKTSSFTLLPTEFDTKQPARAYSNLIKKQALHFRNLDKHIYKI